jgi:hypothetical protein
MVRPAAAGGHVTFAWPDAPITFPGQPTPAPPGHTYSSQVPAALDALVARLRLLPQVTSVPPTLHIHDGEWVWSGTDQQVVVIGWTGFVPGYQYPSRSMSEELGGVAVSSHAVWEGLGPSIRETFTISCASLVRLGEQTADTSVARKIAYGNMALVGANIGPPWLGGTVMKALMGATSSYHAGRDRRGLMTIVGFSIECEAYAQE